MDTLLILFWASFCNLFISLIAIEFPAIYPRTHIKNGAKKRQIVSIVIFLMICIITFLLYTLLKIKTLFLEVKIAVMLLPVLSCILFSLCLYYPLMRFLVRKNIEDSQTVDLILEQIFKCSFGNASTNKNELKMLEKFICDNNKFVTQYGMLIYLSEYIKQAQYSVNSKPDEKFIHCVLDRCNQLKHDIDNFSPIPFPNIGLILSFVFSTSLTVLLSILSL